MEEKNQKYFIFGGVALATVVVIIFWAANFDFIMDGGFAGKASVDKTWEQITESFSKTMGEVKAGIAGAKKETPSSTAREEEILKIMKEKIENVSSTTSS